MDTGNSHGEGVAPKKPPPGWYADPGRPGIQRYWDGRMWSPDIAPRATPEPAWKGARMIALGILIAAAVIFAVWRISQPSEVECATQRLEVTIGDRTTVDAACR